MSKLNNIEDTLEYRKGFQAGLNYGQNAGMEIAIKAIQCSKNPPPIILPKGTMPISEEPAQQQLTKAEIAFLIKLRDCYFDTRCLDYKNVGYNLLKERINILKDAVAQLPDSVQPQKSEEKD